MKEALFSSHGGSAKPRIGGGGWRLRGSGEEHEVRSRELVQELVLPVSSPVASVSSLHVSEPQPLSFQL